MGEWTNVNLSELTDITTRKGHANGNNVVCLNMDCVESGSGKVVAYSTSSLSSDKLAFSTGDVLFAKLRPYLKKYWLAEFDGVCSSEFLVLQAKPRIRSQYLYYIVSSEAFVNYNNSQTYGSKMPRTSWEIAKKFKYRIPELHEQDLILSVLTAADEAIATSRALVDKYAALKQGLMQDLLTSEGEPIKVGRLGGRFFRGQGISRAETTADGVPCIRYGELYTTYDTVTSEVYSRTSKETARHCKHIQYGDLLFTLSGETAEDIGKNVAYIGSADVVVGGDLAVLTGHGQNPIYLSYMLNSASARKQKELASTGSSIVHINATKLGAIIIPLPDIKRQNEVADILTAADDRLTAERRRLAKLENIKRGLMDDLLNNMISTDILEGGREYA